ncbi:DUF4279 domain-containing protein [Aureispira sp. CCB-QB1]|uniref:DUF4279 domain-containing protein n=1 Tax=Aureispira sp. CCB-QB1 TaxID=1313421 RepID=UPI000697DB7F|nr:DUF4279 domain-containing protein [Aureispira sp. CCB-QB1]
MKKENQYIEKAIEEILNPKFETTKQYLKVCEIKMESGKPKVARVNENFFENKVVVYIEVKDERYFIEIHLTKEPEIEVEFVWTESGHRVYLTATSEKLSFKELSKFIREFKPLQGWSKGDFRKNGKLKYDFSRVNFEPIKNEAYGLDEKLELLLDELEKDIEGVLKLSENSNAYISVCRHQYISGNAGVGFEIETINRLNKLNLGIDIDTYIIGNEIK